MWSIMQDGRPRYFATEAKAQHAARRLGLKLHTNEAKNMAIETDVEKLNSTMTDGLAKLNAAVEDCCKLWEGHLNEGHDVMAQARDQGVALGNAIAKVRQFLVGKTNFPPSDGTTEA